MRGLHRHLPLVLPLALLLSGAGVGTLTAYDPALSLPVTSYLWAGGLLYLAIVALCRSASAQRRVAAIIASAGALGALFCFAQYRYYGFERKIELIARVGDLTSGPVPFLGDIPFQQNMAAAYLEGALPVALGLALASHGRGRLLWAVCALLIGAGVLLTVSRGAWGALGVCGVVVAIAALGQRRPRLVAGLLIGGLALAALGGLALLGPWGQQLAGPIAERAASRLSLYQIALPLALDTAFTGIGPGDTFALIYSRYGLLIQVPFLTYAHNLPLAVWMGNGLLGLIGLLGLVVGAGCRFWRAAKAGRGPLWLGAALGSLALLLHGLIDAPQYNPGWYAMLMGWAVLGLAVATSSAEEAGRQEARGARQDDRPATAEHRRLTGAGWIVPSAPGIGWKLPLFGLPPWALVRALLPVLGAAMLVALLWRPLVAQASVNLGAVVEARADLGPGLSDAQRVELRNSSAYWYRQALAIMPGHGAASRRLGVQALAAGYYAEAVALLDQARRAAPASETTRKALGYAYLWGGQVAPASALFDALARRAEVRSELDTYAWWWAAEGGRPDLAAHAAAAARLLDE